MASKGKGRFQIEKLEERIAPSLCGLTGLVGNLLNGATCGGSGLNANLGVGLNAGSGGLNAGLNADASVLGLHVNATGAVNLAGMGGGC